MSTAIISGAALPLGSGVGYFPAQMPSIEDVAWALSCEARWAGQTVWRGRRTFFSVAQHCVVAVIHTPTTLRYNMLMHELAEFCMGDFIGPFKAEVPEFKQMEKRFSAMLEDHFQVPKVGAVERELMKHIDKRAMATERRDLTAWNGTDYWSYIGDVQPWDHIIVPWSIEKSYEHFMNLFWSLAPFDIVVRENTN